MHIAISAIDQGDVIVLPVSDPPKRENTRRLSRSATMDGGSVITDSGYSDSDRTLSFSASNVSEDICDRLWSFFEDESMVYLSCRDGFFAGYLESVSIDSGGGVEVSFMVYEKIV